jgi:hypothetical protein
MAAMKVFIFLVVFFAPAFAKGDPLWVYAAISNECTAVGSLRVGAGKWEFGILADSFLGFDKVYRKKLTYVAFGLGGNFGASSSVGVYGAAGIEFKILGGLQFRGELNATGTSSSYVKGRSQIGLSFNF